MAKKSFLKSCLCTILIIASLNLVAVLGAEIKSCSTIIAEAVKAKMLSNKVGVDLNIEVKDVGIVYLQGRVKTNVEANIVIELAFSTPGVIDVDISYLTIQDGNIPSIDSAITARIRGIYSKEKVLGSEPNSITFIQVETSEGIVYLTGKIDTKAQEEKAERLAKSIKGVKAVKSKLNILNDWRSLS